MRHLTVIAFILIVVCHFEVVSQSCLPNGITFYTQSQIDSFPINYPGCSVIEGWVQVGEYLLGTNISNLDSLYVLTSIEGGLIIQFNPLTDISGLQNLTSIGSSLDITMNPFLTSLNGLEGISFIGGDIIIAENDNLVDLLGLGMLDTLQNGLAIYQNNSLYDLSGLENITHIEGYLSIVGNQLITNLNGLNNLKAGNGQLSIKNNTNLGSFTGLNNLERIGGGVEISGNASLMSFNGLDNLKSIGWYLAIYENEFLFSLDGLNGLDSINGTLKISNNSILSSLSGIDSICHYSIGNLRIYENPSLEICDVQSVCNYLAFPSGAVAIHDNAPGCNSQQEVEEACTVGVPEIPDKGEISVFPNPFITATTIEYELKEISNIQFTIYNVIGEMVYNAEEHMMPQGFHTVTWSPGHLPEGMYYAVLRSEEGVSVVKIVKQ